ncbi:hypothetical protein RxyAA322_11470 [Rubrobacter xylanophilus]|uniref:Uncharacterized protein n=1 Tax=Rubrobacter xylanophilus TaxID=49319 RepID=A0A510HL23_9ACTN|nr:hypothetical protein RxyAA322_11470 [Rubrobacter xylanophilus]
MRAATATLQELRAARDRVRAEYLAAIRTTTRETTVRARRWREFLEANAACLRAKGEMQ